VSDLLSFSKDLYIIYSSQVTNMDNTIQDSPSLEFLALSPDESLRSFSEQMRTRAPHLRPLQTSVAIHRMGGKETQTYQIWYGSHHEMLDALSIVQAHPLPHYQYLRSIGANDPSPHDTN